MRYILYPGWEVNRDNSERAYRTEGDLYRLYQIPLTASFETSHPFFPVEPKPGDIHCRVSHEQDYPLLRKEPNGR